ncbi:DNA-3-methyladenine glycosylase family protein [Yunchengibacter salinarum]|uniref:DNA-3-methyladenine glycosylase family protein n=1 Tax=Yunchengibacter salinarum TaxID=3133399 RepID=UPI0035B65385
MTNPDYRLTDTHIRRDLDTLAHSDPAIARALEQVGYPAARRRSHGFPILLRVIVGQQLSVKAAATIAARLEALMDGAPSPDRLMTLPEDALRGAGLSRQKVTYARSLAEAVASGALDVDTLPRLDDEAAIGAISGVKGLGRWSAEMYLMFSLGRSDIWPVDDLGVRAGAATILDMETRPTPRHLKEIGDRWRPRRSSVALLAWHVLSNAPT